MTSVVISIKVADIGCELSAAGADDDPAELDDGAGGLSGCFFFENMPPRPFTIMADGVVGMSSLREEVFDGREEFGRESCELWVGWPVCWPTCCPGGILMPMLMVSSIGKPLNSAEFFCSSVRP